MIIAIDAILALLLITIGYIATCYQLNNISWKNKNFSVLKVNKNKILYLILAVCSFTTIIVLFQTVYHTIPLTQVKLVVLLATILPCAAVDFKTHKIPNKFLLTGLIARVLIYIVEFIISVDDAVASLKNDVLAALIIGGFFLLLLFIFKNSIGMGDIKLFALMGLYQGLLGVVNSIFFSLMSSFVVSVYLLITKKKTRGDVVSFGPSIFVGTVIGICLAGM